MTAAKRAAYLAGPYASRDTLKACADELDRVGYKIQCRWLGGEHEVSTNDAKERAATPEERAKWAREDLTDIDRADVVIAFTQAVTGVDKARGVSGGRHVETGYAIALGKRVVLIGEPENVFHWLPTITVVPTWHHALIELAAELVEIADRQPTADAVCECAS